MIQPLRKFSVSVVTKYSSFTPGQLYPVLAIDQTEDEDPTVFMLLADDKGSLEWLNQTEVKVISIDD